MRSRAGQIAVLVAGALAAGGTGIAVAQLTTGGGHLRVSPARGIPTSRFVVRFTATATTGTSDGTTRTTTIRVGGSNPAPHSCTNSGEKAVRVARLGLVQVTLSPGAPGDRWCLGTFHGVVQQLVRPACQPGRVCPQFIEVQTIGTFSFTVAATAAADTGPSLTVTPKVGTPSTTFRVKLRRLLVTGPGVTLDATVYLQGRHRGECQAGAGEATGDVPAHIRRLRFASGVGKWCVGSYVGTATETITPVCAPGTACPAVVAVRPLGRFSFVVRP